jgi:hypothetical protein
MRSIPGSSFILTSRRLSFYHFQHIGEFGKLLDDRHLMSALIHFSSCLNPSCREANGRGQRWLTSNAEIPAAIIARMEAWRTKIEGWPSQPESEVRGGEKKPLDPPEPGV